MEDSPPPVATFDPPSGDGWSEMTPTLPPLGILAGMSERSLANLAPFGKYSYYNPKDIVIREGQQQDCIHIIVLGKLSISALVDGKDVALNETFPGECLGEIGMLAPGPATATVRALEKTTLWSMNIEDFRQYIAEHVGGAGALLLGIASCLCHRMRHANALISSHRMKPVEMLPAGRERAITADNTPMQLGFFDRLKKSLGG